MTAAYSEAGGWGITWKEWYSWQVFLQLVEKIKDVKEGMGAFSLSLSLFKENSLQFKKTQIEWEIPPCGKYLESVIVSCW